VGPLVREALGDAERLAGWQASSLPRREMVKALIEAYDERRAWPSGRSWERAAARHAVRWTYIRLFGSWPAAVAAAEAAVVRRGGGVARRRTELRAGGCRRIRD
jgi:hypothetical protein